MILLKAGLAEAMDETMMNGQWDTSCDVTLIVFLIVCAVYVNIAIGIHIAQPITQSQNQHHKSPS